VSVAILVDSAFDFSSSSTGDEEAFSPEPLSEEDRLKKVFGSPAANNPIGVLQKPANES
jgi:hypothetical protein